MDESRNNTNDNIRLISRRIDAYNAQVPEQAGETLHDDFEYDPGNTFLINYLLVLKIV